MTRQHISNALAWLVLALVALIGAGAVGLVLWLAAIVTRGRVG